MDVKGEKQEAVYIVNAVTADVTPIGINKIASVVKPVYVRQETTG